MKTRQDYLNRNCTHQEYYAQFITPGIIRLVVAKFGRAQLQNCNDPHFNSIPLSQWDDISPRINAVAEGKLKEAGDGCSLSSGVCIAKVAAEIIRSGKSFV